MPMNGFAFASFKRNQWCWTALF